MSREMYEAIILYSYEEFRGLRSFLIILYIILVIDEELEPNML